MTLLRRKTSATISRAARDFQTMFEDISKAAERIFSPIDDDYPQTGVQPFNGDIPDDRYRQPLSW